MVRKTGLLISIFEFFRPAQANQNLLVQNIQPSPNSNEETITLYAGSSSPPQQVIRPPPGQLLVTDNKQGQPQLPNQLQLPQKPMPPNLPKPVPSKGPEPHKPKIIPGKVAVCPNCGGFSNDLAKCVGCKKVIKEGAKIMPDPDYRPPAGEDKKIIVGNQQGDLRNIRIQHGKKGRKAANNDEPECIALSSDEDEDDETNETASGEAGETEAGVDSQGAKSGENGENSSSEGKNAEGKLTWGFILGLVW
jgi:hypothetical protein